MRPIDGKALYKQVAESEEKARDRFLDTSSSLPCPSYINPAYTRYNEQLNERTRLKHMIADAPTIELPHWIPCSERLPKYPYRVQIQLDNGWIITGYYSEEHWYTVPHCGGFLRNDEVEAWRELPEPYGGESDE